tara:strand:- start:618 stop:1202 length:585 start_codon:yes stop_codon:yes gene_type:complete
MVYLVKISETVREISVLKKKMLYDSMNAPEYEEKMWVLYTEVTRLKDKFYKAKARVEDGAGILNAQITFRDIQARNKALQIYNMNPLKRCCVQGGCYMKHLKLADKGVYEINHADNPIIILWENVAEPMKSKISRCFKNYSISVVIFVFTFFGMWATQLFEKLRAFYVRSDCSGNDFYNIDYAFEDHTKPPKEN